MSRFSNRNLVGLIHSHGSPDATKGNRLLIDLLGSPAIGKVELVLSLKLNEVDPEYLELNARVAEKLPRRSEYCEDTRTP